MDHLVIGHGRFVSLKESGLGFDGRVSETRPGYRLRSTRYSIQEDDNLIYAYTRSQALTDDVLVDVTQMASEADFRYPPPSLLIYTPTSLRTGGRKRWIRVTKAGCGTWFFWLPSLHADQLHKIDAASWSVFSKLTRLLYIAPTTAPKIYGWWWGRAIKGSRSSRSVSLRTFREAVVSGKSLPALPAPFENAYFRERALKVAARQKRGNILVSGAKPDNGQGLPLPYIHDVSGLRRGSYPYDYECEWGRFKYEYELGSYLFTPHDGAVPPGWERYDLQAPIQPVTAVIDRARRLATVKPKVREIVLRDVPVGESPYITIV